jgi:hypothetical protein
MFTSTLDGGEKTHFFIGNGADSVYRDSKKIFKWWLDGEKRDNHLGVLLRLFFLVLRSQKFYTRVLNRINYQTLLGFRQRTMKELTATG